jgi:glyoxylase-like metal-dependent hydrolase (beta-lactamase superfamily II)
MASPTVLPLRISNPFFEGRNEVYVILADPITIIDTGIATQHAYDRLLAKLSEHNLKVDDIGRVILTHKHIDHIGNAWRIQQASGAEIMIHESEVPAVVETDSAGNRFRDLVAERMQQWRVDETARPQDKPNRGQGWEIQPAAAVGLTEGQRIEVGGAHLEVIHTPGHTFGSICLRLGNQLFSGDHVLANTSPNVGGGDLRRKGLLKLFLSSLQRMIRLAPEIDTVYPGHGDPFSDLASRCKDLADHHQNRLDQLEAIVRKDGQLSIYETAVRLFGDLKDHHVMLGCAEAQSHLEYLADQGRVTHDDHLYRLA